jgi:hypothetical protein
LSVDQNDEPTWEFHVTEKVARNLRSLFPRSFFAIAKASLVILFSLDKTVLHTFPAPLDAFLGVMASF